MARASIAYNSTESLVFGDVTETVMNSEVHRDILSDHIQPNAARLI